MTGRRLRPAAGPLLVVAALALQPLPANAQVSSFLDGLFGRKEEPAPPPAASPAPEAAPAPAKKAAQKPAKGADKGADKTAEKPSEKPAEKTGSLKTAAKPGAPATPAAPAGTRVAAVGAPNLGVSLQDADPATVVAAANGYFNGFQTLTGSFIQIGADGRRIGGKLTLAKPGRLRFEYDQPSPLEVVADGTSVAVRDRKLNTQDLYFISQTPLKFLLRDKIDLARDLTVTEVTNDPGGVRIALEDRSTLGGTSKIQLFFDAEMKTLSQWRITDPQGYLTTVQLSNLQKGKAVDGSLFFINYGRAEDKAMQRQIESQNP
ncbi:outer-membrane lipoprotein carrier protein LolA [Methylorubrum podarium]|jgi:outer membrane lipoprotein-sorting protein|uniref:outer-membrane lipoprotein carrier protein LolA n=1 Tax=Methylorubrum podarium TaxID=200476 RepID=UPI001EE35D37|nr:outer-membrane lipoprotein carrier protein LolA [Methylorubrum podarium]GJE71438.1 Outer-membrane lipoprotein carrier protein [Methylorubrum podarium]